MTENIRKKLVIAVICAHMLFFAVWYAMEADMFDRPVATIKVKTVAYDPRDLLSGQYIRIAYTFSRVRTVYNSKTKTYDVSDEWAKNVMLSEKNSNSKRRRYHAPKLRDATDIWVILHEAEDGFYEPKDAYYSKPDNLKDGEILLKGRANGWRGIEYGIEKYFVPEGTREPARDKTHVMLDVYEQGKVRINQVLVDGKAWP